MASPIVQFVDSPSTTATLRYDFNVSNPTLKCFPLHEGVDLGAPSFTGEPEGVGVFYGYRQMRITQRIIGTRAVALARMSLLAKEILRPQNWLRFQFDASASPVFFKTYHTEPGGMSLENAGSADAWDLVVPLEADGFAYGPRQTITQAQIIQAPADLAGPTRLAMHYILPTILGEAPAPLRVTVTPAATQNAGANCAWLLGNIAGTASMADTVVNIGGADGFTAGTGTAASSANAAMFAGDQRIVTIGAASGLINRLSGSFPALPSGRYKVLLRCEADGSTASTRQFLFRLGTGTTTTTDLVTLPSTSVTVPQFGGGPYVFRGWVDLGDLTLPFANSPAANLPDTPPTPSSTFPGVFTLDIGVADGLSATVRLDALKVIPIDGPTVKTASLLRATYPAQGYQPNATVTIVNSPTFDADSESSWMTETGGAISTGTVPNVVQFRGVFPYVDPAAAQNLLILMALSQGNQLSASSVTALNAQCAVDASYYPRYMHIGNGS